MNESTKIHFADKSGTFIFTHFIENSSLSSTVLWNYLSKKYYGTPLIDLIRDNLLHEVFSLLNHRHITPDERVLLASTIPGVVMKRSDAIHYFAAVLTMKEKGVIGNFPEISISLIKGLHKGAFFVSWEYNERIYKFWNSPVENKTNVLTQKGISELLTLAGLNEKA